MRLKGYNDIPQTCGAAQLPENERKQLIPTGIVLDIAVAVVLCNNAPKLVLIEKLYNL